MTPRIAVVGCGAIARSLHLPALARHRELLPHVVLVDRDSSRAAALAAEFGIERTAETCASVLDSVDGVIVTVPHHLHFAIAMECLGAGKHVLCEKPLAESSREAREMVAAASAAGVTLSANHTRRLYPATRRIAELVSAGELGALRRMEFFWGEKFDWPAASGFYFGIGGAPHGVLFDKGPHALDLVCWWLGGKPDVVRCVDDSCGGGEAMASLVLRHGECEVTAEFSFLSRYPNTYTIEGERGRIEGSLYEFRKFDTISASGQRRTIVLPSTAAGIADFGPVMVDNFLAVVAGQAQPEVPAASVLDSVTLIEECYARRQRYEMPWHDAWRRVVNE